MAKYVPSTSLSQDPRGIHQGDLHGHREQHRQQAGDPREGHLQVAVIPRGGVAGRLRSPRTRRVPTAAAPFCRRSHPELPPAACDDIRMRAARSDSPQPFAVVVEAPESGARCGPSAAAAQSRVRRPYRVRAAARGVAAGRVLSGQRRLAAGDRIGEVGVVGPAGSRTAAHRSELGRLDGDRRYAVARAERVGGWGVDGETEAAS